MSSTGIPHSADVNVPHLELDDVDGVIISKNGHPAALNISVMWKINHI